VDSDLEKAQTSEPCSKIASDNNWLPAKITYQKCRLPIKNACRPKNIIKGEEEKTM
jgi:hypothetical protein